MNVSMDKIAWGVMVNKPLINLKPFVTLVFCIMNMPRRGMGNNNIDASLPPSPYSNASHYFPHLAFSVLMRTPVIPKRPLQSQDVDSLEIDQFGVQINTSIRQL